MTATLSQPVDRRMVQRMVSLERANRVRLGRAVLKRRIARGEVRLSLLLLAPPPEALSWPVGDLLCAQRQWGRARARKLLVRVGVGELRPVGRLTARQRAELSEALS